MTNGSPPRKPPQPPARGKVQPIEERFAPPPGQRGPQPPEPPETYGQQPHYPELHPELPPGYWHGHELQQPSYPQQEPHQQQHPAPYGGHDQQPGQNHYPAQPTQAGHPAHAPLAHAMPPQYRGGGDGAHGHGGHPPQYPPHGGHGHQRPPQRSGLGGLLLVALIGIGVVLAAAVAFILIAPPTDLIREQAINLVKQRTGRDLVIAGPARLAFYPSLGVSLEDVTLSAPPDMGGAPTVAMKSLDVSVKLLPLLSRRVEVDRLVLTAPRFDLRVDRAGRKSWDMAIPATARTLRYAEAADENRHVTGVMTDAPTTHLPLRLAQGTAQPAATAPGRTTRMAALNDLVLGDVRIIDGTLDYRDARSGSRHAASAINVAIKAKTLASPLAAEGDLSWQGQTIRFNGTLTTLAEVLADAPAKLALKIAAQPLNANYSGSIDVATGGSLNGVVSADTKSLRALALWAAKTRLPPNDGFGALKIKGRLKTRPDAFQLANADITLDEMRVTGTLDGKTGGARPYVKANLKVSELNLNTYISNDTTAGSGAGAGGSVQGAAPAKGSSAGQSTSNPPTSIEDLLERQTGPRVKGYTARSGWSDERIDFAMLNLVDADLNLTVGKLLVRDIKVDRSDIRLALKNGNAKTIFDRVDLYGGNGRGQISIDSGRTAAAMTANLVVDGVSAEPLLQDAADIDWLSGNGRLTLATTSSGNTQRKLVSALSGKATFIFNDGAVKGFNVAKALRGLQQGRLTSLSSTPSEKTDFSKLSASFDIADGIAANQDLEMMSPLLRITGNGRVMLPDRRVDYTLNPKLVADLSGQDGKTGLDGLQIPIRIVGPWAKPNIAPDLSKIDAGQAVQAIEQIGKSLKGKNAGEVVDDLFGKDSKEGQKAKKFLDQLFR